MFNFSLPSRVRRALVIASAIAFGPLCGGCLVVGYHEEIVRQGEPRRPIGFESDAAMFHFKDTVDRRYAANDHVSHVDECYSFVPLLYFGGHVKSVSKAGYFNDSVGEADIDGDGQITDDEVQQFTR